jgi:Na+-driven multidrug efflux pump
MGSDTLQRVGNLLGARSAKGAALATRVAIFMTLVVAMVMRYVYCHMRTVTIDESVTHEQRHLPHL